MLALWLSECTNPASRLYYVPRDITIHIIGEQYLRHGPTLPVPVPLVKAAYGRHWLPDGARTPIVDRQGRYYWRADNYWVSCQGQLPPFVYGRPSPVARICESGYTGTPLILADGSFAYLRNNIVHHLDGTRWPVRWHYLRSEQNIISAPLGDRQIGDVTDDKAYAVLPDGTYLFQHGVRVDWDKQTYFVFARDDRSHRWLAVYQLDATGVIFVARVELLVTMKGWLKQLYYDGTKFLLIFGAYRGYGTESEPLTNLICVDPSELFTFPAIITASALPLKKEGTDEVFFDGPLIVTNHEPFSDDGVCVWVYY